MQSLTTAPASREAGPTSGTRRALGWRRLGAAGAVVAGALVLFAGYLRLSRTAPANADGASNALQAWDMLHGNVLLHGWTVTDVSFYTTELVQYMLVELVHGYRADVIHVAAAMTYTLLVLLTAVVAKGRTTGREAAARVIAVLVVMVAPGPVTGYTVLLGSPDHFGSAVPVLLAWLVVDRAADRRWLPAVVAVLLAWGAIADPLVMYLGALPLALVGLVRLVRTPGWSAPDAWLLLAAVGSVVLAKASLIALRAAGGFHVHAPTAEFTDADQLGKHLWLAAKSIFVIFGSYLPEQGGPLGIAVGVLHGVAIAAVATAVVVTLARLVRRPGTDRVSPLLAVGISVNVGAFVVSTLPVDLLTARQLVGTLPLGAALAARVLTPAALPRRGWMGPGAAAALALLAVFTAAFAVRAVTARPVPATAHEVGTWLQAHDLRYGLGSYWAANVITLDTSGRVQVAPVTGEDRIMGYRWESREGWYDPGRYDARFVIIDVDHKAYGTVAAATAQFGPPVERHDIGRWTVLVYDHNLLVGLPAYCVPEVVPTMADCP